MARTYPAKRSRIAADEGIDIEVSASVGTVTFYPRCPICCTDVREGTRVVDGSDGALLHARCADAGEALL